MKNSRRSSRVLLVALLVLTVASLGALYFQMVRRHTRAPVKVPTLSALAQTGKSAFDTHCVRCHGANAAGGDRGPPLVHDLYNPSRHDDGSFRRARTRGVRAHHWHFGDMPPQPQVTDAEMTAIIEYLRALQRANGIFAPPRNPPTDGRTREQRTR